jgi:hypothetical protein
MKVSLNDCLVFDVIKYMSNKRDYFLIDYSQDLISKRSNSICQEMEHEFDGIQFGTSCWQIDNLHMKWNTIAEGIPQVIFYSLSLASSMNPSIIHD